MAACERTLKRYVRTREMVESYLAKGEVAQLLTEGDRQAARALLAALKPLIAQVRIAVNQDGADVFIDGARIGVSPVVETIDVDLGARTFAARKRGYQEAVLRKEVAGGASVDVLLQLERSQARLRVAAPVDSQISINGKVVGMGDWEGVLPAGRHRLRASSSFDYETEIQLEEGDNKSVSVTQPEGPTRWPWWVLAAVVAGGLAAGGYVLFKPGEQPIVPGNWGDANFR
jgi:hypothetical protein